MLAPITNDVPVIAPPLIAPLVVKPSEPKLIVVTPVPVATATVLAVVSKSKVKFSLFVLPTPAKVKTPVAPLICTPVLDEFVANPPVEVTVVPSKVNPALPATVLVADE